MESARTFTIRLQELLHRERSALGDFLVALSEFDQRKLWVDLGYSSLFDFLHRELGLSKASASFRKKASELVQRFPEIADALRDGRLCLTSVFELGKVLTPENRDEVLPRFFQLSRREAKTVAAALQPQAAPATRDVVTVARVRAEPAMLALLAPATGVATGAASAIGPAQVAVPAATPKAVCPVKLGRANEEPTPHEDPRPASPPRIEPARAELNLDASSSPAAVEPLTAELNRLHVTVSRRFLRKLEAARDALSHSHPGAGMEEILEVGLDLLLDRHAKRKGLVKKPLRQPRPAKPGHVPALVLRAVWERDGGRCQWKLASGGICASTVRVEIDHRVAKARGGPPTVANLRCLCERHNDLAARETFGDPYMDRYTRGLRRREGSVRNPRLIGGDASPASPPSPP